MAAFYYKLINVLATSVSTVISVVKLSIDGDLPINDEELVFPFNDKWRLQYPRLCDSLLHPSREHKRRHCLPLNFLRIPPGF